MGGGGLYGTAGDYLAFAQMIMNGGTHKGAQVLRRETVDQMSQNHIGAIEIRRAEDRDPAAVQRRRRCSRASARSGGSAS